jgi:polyhydroxyalkanoate synthase
MQALAARSCPPPAKAPDPGDFQHWAMSGAKLQKMWLDFLAEQPRRPSRLGPLADGGAGRPCGRLVAAMPLARAETQAKLWDESLQLWNSVIDLYAGQAKKPGLPPSRPMRSPPRPPLCRSALARQPWFALLHQTYLLLAERLEDMAEEIAGLEPNAMARCAS